MLRGFMVLVLYMTSLVAIFFITAGRLDLWMGWAALGIYILISLINYFLSDPELVKERSQIREGIDWRDTGLAVLSFLFFYPLTLLVAGLDVGRMTWTKSFPFVYQFIALIFYTLGNVVGSWAVISNRYFSTFVRVQEDRGHEVINQGPYRFVRHPGYAGTILAAIALPIALGSLWALVPAVIGAAGFILRTAFEDGLLKNRLAGYRQYAFEVRQRLLPGLC